VEIKTENRAARENAAGEGRIGLGDAVESAWHAVPFRFDGAWPGLLSPLLEHEADRRPDGAALSGKGGRRRQTVDPSGVAHTRTTR
jgi:hypothetical protein